MSEFEKLFSQYRKQDRGGLKVIAKKEWIEQEMKKDSVLNEWKSKE